MNKRHEQSRTDRDSYLRVLWENVPAQFKEAFAKYGRDKIDSLGKTFTVYSSKSETVQVSEKGLSEVLTLIQGLTVAVLPSCIKFIQNVLEGFFPSSFSLKSLAKINLM